MELWMPRRQEASVHGYYFGCEGLPIRTKHESHYLIMKYNQDIGPRFIAN